MLIILIQILFTVSEKKNHAELINQLVTNDIKDEALILEEYISVKGLVSLENLAGKMRNRYTVLNKDGVVIFDSEKIGKEEEMDLHRYREEIKESFQGREGFSLRKSRTLNKRFLYYSRPFQNGLVIRTSTDYDKYDLEIRNHALKYGIFFLILNIFIILLYKYYISSFYKQKVSLMKEIIEKGEEVPEIYLEDEEDLKELWQVIKLWQNQNLINIEKLGEETEKLREIISSIDVGILVIKENGEIGITNQEVENNILSKIKNIKYYEKIKYVELIKYINKLIEFKQSKKEEIRLTDVKKHYIIQGKYLEKRKLYIITLKDITKDKEMNEIQKRFITNISHELKTPLTNIKGYLIALEGEKDEEVKENFLNTIKKNIAKIENMIVDFLSISKIENSRILNNYPVSMEKIMESIENSLNILIENKNVKLKKSFNIKDSNNFVNLDFEKITIVLKNLIENGIIYNDKEIPEIEINVSEDEKTYNFIVADNGLGIPKEDYERIFERFYRVDKARTSNVAGTGLGLSIVDEILKLYDGQIKIESEEGLGTKIILTIHKV